MNPADADRQIDQMIAFIKQEAKEKAEEIRIKTEKEFAADKHSIESQARIQIRNEHEKHKKNLQIQKRIEKSKKLSEARFATMRARDDKVNMVKKEVLEKLAEVAKKPEYKTLIRYLIAQGLLVLQETNVTLKCRKEDIAIVKAEIQAGMEMYKKAMKDSTTVEPKIEVTLNENEFLAPAPKKGVDVPSCAGGVVLYARGGKIVCSQTLDHRLDLAFESLKPAIRGLMFGVREKLHSTSEQKRGPVSLPK